MQIQKDDAMDCVTDRVINLGANITEQDLDHVEFADTLVNPTLEQVNAIEKNILIVGAGGCGKTYMLQQMKDVIMTATTSCAAELLNGVTIHSYITKNR